MPTPLADSTLDVTTYAHQSKQHDYINSPIIDDVERTQSCLVHKSSAIKNTTLLNIQIICAVRSRNQQQVKRKCNKVH